MKQVIFILFAFIILSCNHPHKKSDLLGTWDIVYSTDIETGEVEFPEDDDKWFVEFKSDSLYLISENSEEVDVYAWQIEGDSILLNEFDSVFIKEMTPDTLTVEYDFMGEIRLTFKKRK